MTELEDILFWELAGKKIAGEITKEEDVVLNSLLNKYPDLLYSLETIGHYWRASKENGEHLERESALDKHLIRMQELNLLPGEKPGVRVILLKKSARLYRRIAVAAAITGLVAIFAFLYHNTKKSPVIATASSFVKSIIALKESKNHFVLPDGSKIWLNAGTTVKYLARTGTGTTDPGYLPPWFSDSTREIFLTGEAYFEVKHDEKHPFLIHTSQVDILDVGTAFNVKAYPSDNITETTLVEGSIQVKIKDGKEVKTLSNPHEKLTVHSTRKNDSVVIKEKQDQPITEKPLIQSLKISTTISKIQDDSLLAETAWLNGAMIFRNESFEELAVRMERWYNISIYFEKVDYKKYRFSGTFHNETIEEALKELQVIKSFSFVIENNRVVIR